MFYVVAAEISLEEQYRDLLDMDDSSRDDLTAHILQICATPKDVNTLLIIVRLNHLYF